jgi:hypothetical protein
MHHAKRIENLHEGITFLTEIKRMHSAWLYQAVGMNICVGNFRHNLISQFLQKIRGFFSFFPRVVIETLNPRAQGL